jgi:hypothetical protein
MTTSSLPDAALPPIVSAKDWAAAYEAMQIKEKELTRRMSEGADRPIHDIDLVAHLEISPHHRRMIETAWTLGGDPRYERLNLRRWAHMLGFPGHFLTKSHRYSVTFGAIRSEWRTWRLAQDLASSTPKPTTPT